MSHDAMGRKGRKNCRVIGMIKVNKSALAISVLMIAPGDSIMERQNMPSIASIKY